MRLLSDVRTDAQFIRKYIRAWSYFYLIKEGNDLRETSLEEIEERIPRAYAALFDHMYGNLTILDAKANVLIASSSIFTAALGIILTTGLQSSQHWLVTALSLDTIISLISVLLAISVVSVHWSTVEELELPYIDDFVRHLVYVRNSRTLRYRAAWLLHIVVILFSFGMLLVKLSGI